MAVSVLAGCGKTEEAAKKDKVKVAVSFDAMGEFVKAVGKDKVEVHTVIPAGTEPHGFEPSTETMKALSGADVFVYNGLGMEPWQEKVVEAAHNDKLVKIEASKGIDAIKNTDPEEVEEHGEFDPHAWLIEAVGIGCLIIKLKCWKSAGNAAQTNSCRHNLLPLSNQRSGRNFSQLNNRIQENLFAYTLKIDLGLNSLPSSSCSPRAQLPRNRSL